MLKKLKNLFRHLLLPMILWVAITGMLLTTSFPVFAQNNNGQTQQKTETPGGTTGNPSDIIKNIGDQTKLPSYDTNAHTNASFESGASNITSAIYYAIDFLKYILGSIAVVTIVIAGVKLITAGRQIEEVATKQKEHLKYAIIGLVIIIVADPFIKQVFFGESGEIYGSQSQIQAAAEQGSEYVRGLYSTYMYFAGAIAVLMIIVAGFRLVTGAGNEDVQGKSKRTITYAVLGLLLLGVAEFVFKDLIFPQQGSTLPDVERTNQFIVTLTNFIAGFLSLTAFIMYIYAGFLYVTAAANEDNTGKAKKIFLGATIGLLLAMAAFGIVTTLVRFDPAGSGQQSGSSANLPTNPTLP